MCVMYLLTIFLLLFYIYGKTNMSLIQYKYKKIKWKDRITPRWLAINFCFLRVIISFNCVDHIKKVKLTLDIIKFIIFFFEEYSSLTVLKICKKPIIILHDKKKKQTKLYSNAQCIMSMDTQEIAEHNITGLLNPVGRPGSISCSCSKYRTFP
jgi:hypothetical protein